MLVTSGHHPGSMAWWWCALGTRSGQHLVLGPGGCRAAETRVAQRLAGRNASKMHDAWPSLRQARCGAVGVPRPRSEVEHGRRVLASPDHRRTEKGNTSMHGPSRHHLGSMAWWWCALGTREGQTRRARPSARPDLVWRTTWLTDMRAAAGVVRCGQRGVLVPAPGAGTSRKTVTRSCPLPGSTASCLF